MRGDMAHPEIQGCFEAQVPVATRAVLRLGALAHVCDRSLSTVPNSGFALTQLAARTGDMGASYLAGMPLVSKIGCYSG